MSAFEQLEVVVARPSRSTARWLVGGTVLGVTVGAVVAEVALTPGHRALVAAYNQQLVRLTSGYDAVASRNNLEHFVLLAVLASFIVSGTVIVLHRSRNAVGWILIGIGGSAVWITPLTTRGEHLLLRAQQPDLATTFGLWVNAWYWPLLLAAIVFHLPVLFPDGRLPSARWRPVAWVVNGAVAALVVMGMTAPVLGGVDVEAGIDNPIGIAWMPATEGSTIGDGLFLGLLVGLAAGVTALVVRFRRSRGVERQQLKWFLAAASLLLLLPVGEALEGMLDGVLPPGTAALSFPLLIMGLPTAITIAVLRHRLWDIDRVISRTLAYALLAALLAGVYLGGVLALGAVARAATGESGDVVVALSTLAVAAAFQPLRHRVRQVVDRRFNRARYDAVRVVERFGRDLRDQVSVDTTVRELRHVAAETVHPSSSSVLVLDGGGS